ncbi:molybdopterin guanine dinucleotide synthase [Catenovulum agarivorans DS-2]|uniref:Molybdopterin guanine dinucleotide synthase n=1 Tax=Catenovulum agarivorans DS-2 TaxID=1328313 RepID=W7QB16_9ALTE|nr:molybdenum cofactor guanylyltransferase [Catenovulum agarivorans]EWH10049.1 molybdopterin guanine dinucleotide synthase [Catenovulum agarivorans DS-2]
MSLDVLILAGGRSSRMGQDKALLQLDAQANLLQHLVSLVSELSVNHIYISRPFQQQLADSQLCQALISDKLTFIYDKEEYLGPLAGIQTCLQFIQIAKNTDQQLLVIPIDMPALNSRDLAQLIASSGELKTSLYYADHFLPVVFYDLAQLSQVLNQIMLAASNQRSFKTLLAKLSAKTIAVSAQRRTRLVNLNTSEQWQTYLQSRN